MHLIIKLDKKFDLDNISVDKKSHKNILHYDISYRNLIDSKPLRIRFEKIDGFIGICDETKYLTLLIPEKYDAIYSRIRYLISLKVASHTFFLTISQKSKLIIMILYI